MDGRVAAVHLASARRQRAATDPVQPPRGVAMPNGAGTAGGRRVR